MSYKRGLEIGSALMDMGFKYKNAMDSQKEQERKDKEFKWAELEQQWKTDDKEIESQTGVFQQAILESPGFDLSDEDKKDPKKAQAFWNASIRAANRQEALNRRESSGMTLDRERASANLQKAADKLVEFKAAMRNGNTEKMDELFTSFINDNAWTGNSITNQTEDSIEFTNWKGNKTSKKKLTPLEQEKFMAEYLGDKKMAMAGEFAGLGSRRKQNTTSMQNAVWYQHKETGNLIKGLGFGKGEQLFDPMTGDEMEPFYTTSHNPNSLVENMDKKYGEEVNLAEYDLVPTPRTELERRKEKATTEGLEEDVRIKKTKPGSDVSPTESLAGIKLAATKRFMDGKATPEDKALINQDKEPLLSQAIKMVTDDMNSWGLTQEEKINKVKENLELLRGMGDRKQPGGLAQPGQPAPGGGDYIDSLLEKGKALSAQGGGRPQANVTTQQENEARSGALQGGGGLTASEIDARSRIETPRYIREIEKPRGLLPTTEEINPYRNRRRY